jgi:hypothetical protein
LKNSSITNPSVFDQIPNLLILELISCSTSNSHLLYDLTNLEQLTLENNDRDEFKVNVPQTVKFLYLRCQNLSEELQTGIFRNLPNLISLRIDCGDDGGDDETQSIHDRYDDDDYDAGLFLGLSSLMKLELGGIRIIPNECLSYVENFDIC